MTTKEFIKELGKNPDWPLFVRFKGQLVSVKNIDINISINKDREPILIIQQQ